MDINMVPTIKVNVETMKASIVSTMGINDSVLQGYIETEIDKAIADYPFEKEVKRIVHDAIQESIERYFTWGQGRVEIDKALEISLKKE